MEILKYKFHCFSNAYDRYLIPITAPDSHLFGHQATPHNPLTPWEQRVFCCLEDIVPHGKQTIEA